LEKKSGLISKLVGVIPDHGLSSPDEVQYRISQILQGAAAEIFVLKSLLKVQRCPKRLSHLDQTPPGSPSKPVDARTLEQIFNSVLRQFASKI
jgi:hypothetical protein